MEYRRRDVLKLAAAGSAHFLATLAGCSDASREVVETDGGARGDADGPEESLFLGGFLTSLTVEHSYEPNIEGDLPRELAGVLYRNGPGLFERDGVRKRTLVDGDGMVNAYFFDGGRVTFRNRYVRTDKFIEEEEAQTFLYDTWTTKAPGGGLVPDIADQAGVSVRKFAGRVLVFDEGSFPWEIDPETLETRGSADMGASREETVFAAHPKIVAGDGRWVHFGVDYATGTLRLTVYEPDGSLAFIRSHSLSSLRYVHDFFATSRYAVVMLNPAELNLSTLFSGATVRDALEWKPENGTQVLVFDLQRDEPPRELGAAPRWMWHTGNAFEASGKLVLDYVGYDDADHFLGSEADFEKLMRDDTSTSSARGKLMRTEIDLSAMNLTEQALTAADGYEFPSVNPRRLGSAYRYLFSVFNPHGTVLWTGLARYDTESGQSTSYDFGKNHVCGEPIFVPKPGANYDGSAGAEPGWLLAEVTSIRESRASLAVFDAEHVEDGPIAQVKLDHHLPIRFHGHWAPA